MVILLIQEETATITGAVAIQEVTQDPTVGILMEQAGEVPVDTQMGQEEATGGLQGLVIILQEAATDHLGVGILQEVIAHREVIIQEGATNLLVVIVLQEEATVQEDHHLVGLHPRTALQEAVGHQEEALVVLRGGLLQEAEVADQEGINSIIYKHSNSQSIL